MARNATALYAVHMASFVLPLLSVPYLARVLRPDAWGLVVFSQSFSVWLSLVLEYGFALSATRMIARQPGDASHVADVVARVQGAKCILLAPALLIALGTGLTVPTFRDNPGYLVWALVIAIATGFNPGWYYQGIERMSCLALAEVIGRVATVSAIFALVRRPEHGWMVLMLQACAATVSVGAMTALMYRAIPWVRPTVRGGWTMLVEASGLFLFRSASGVYTFANSFILGMFAEARVVAYYGGAEKLVRAGIGLLGPVSQAMYPRVTNLVATDPVGARRLLRISLVAVGSLGVVSGIAVLALAPVLVRSLLGPGYDAAIPILRVLALLLPTIAIGTVLGVQWALPLGLDRPFYVIVVCAGVLDVLAAMVLVPRYGALGMAWAVVLTESFVVVGLLGLFLRHHGPLRWVRSAGRSVTAAAEQ